MLACSDEISSIRGSMAVVCLIAHKLHLLHEYVKSMKSIGLSTNLDGDVDGC